MTLEAAVRDYRRQGYCILPDGLSPAELDSLTAAADALLDETVDDGGMRTFRRWRPSCSAMACSNGPRP